jgi:3-oxoacyl-ACP reductase-like protein
MVAPTPVSTPAQMVAPTPVSAPYPAFEEINLDQELQEELADLQMEFIPQTEQQTTIEQLEEIDTAQSLVEMNNSRSNLDRLKSSVKDLLSADLKKENIQ